jgi:hypothetical protein
MADEFIKGLGIFTGAGLGWLTLASWYRVSSFEATDQLIAPLQIEGELTMFDQIGVLLMDALLWFALLGAFTFWVVIPVGREILRSVSNRLE